VPYSDGSTARPSIGSLTSILLVSSGWSARHCPGCSAIDWSGQAGQPFVGFDQALLELGHGGLGDAVDLLVIQTGWDDHWGTGRYFDHPYLTREAADWLADRLGFGPFRVDLAGVLQAAGRRLWH